MAAAALSWVLEYHPESGMPNEHLHTTLKAKKMSAAQRQEVVIAKVSGLSSFFRLGLSQHINDGSQRRWHMTVFRKVQIETRPTGIPFVQ